MCVDCHQPALLVDIVNNIHVLGCGSRGCSVHFSYHLVFLQFGWGAFHRTFQIKRPALFAGTLATLFLGDGCGQSVSRLNDADAPGLSMHFDLRVFFPSSCVGGLRFLLHSATCCTDGL